MPIRVAVADVNGDGKPDIVVANWCGNNTTCNTGPGAEHGSVGVLLGNGDGTFRPGSETSTRVDIMLAPRGGGGGRKRGRKA